MMISGWTARQVISGFLILLGCASCGGPGTHLVTPTGQGLPELDYLWEEVNQAFPEQLPSPIKVVLVGGPHSSFMIETRSIGIPSYLKSHVRNGKICRELTHLALHYASGGDEEKRGRCFDNDVVFLEQAVAGYMDRKGAGLLEAALEEAHKLAAADFRAGTLNRLALRDWETFFFRGFWSDQFKEWNLNGLRSLVSLGDFLVNRFGMARVSRVFAALGPATSLDQALAEVLEMDTETLIRDWREQVLEAVPEPVEPPEQGGGS